MSMGATLSILGLYQFDNHVFDLMAFPEGFSDEQKSIVTNNILAECAELEFLYPSAEVAKDLIGIWSRKELPYWDRVYKASLLKYDPIENYRRNETESISDDKTEEHSGSDVARAGGSDSQTGSSSSTETNSGTDTVTNSTTGYDSNDFVSHDRSQTTYGHQIGDSASGTNTQTYGRTDTMQHGEKIDHTGTTARQLLAYGNIGTMTSQDMLTQELNVAKIVNVIPIIIDSFKDRFCIMVY